MTTYSKTQLQAKLPTLPKASRNHLSTSFIIGLTTKLTERFVLIKQHGILYDIHYKPRIKVNLMSQNAARSKILTLDSGQAGFVNTLNLGLKGGDEYPILTAFLSVGVGIFTAGAGAVFSILSGVASAAKVNQPVRARLGDEIWQLEVVGKEGGEIKPMEYLVLIDPYRTGSKSRYISE